MQIRYTSRWAGITLAALAVSVVGVSAWAKHEDSSSKAASDEGLTPGARWVFRMSPAKSFSAASPGDFGGVASAPRQDVLRVGFFVSDGAGNLTGHTLATTDTDAGKTWLVAFDWTGKYVANSDGTGFFSVDTIDSSTMSCTDMTVAHSGPTPHPVASGGLPAMGNTACPTGAAAIEGHEDYAFVGAGGSHVLHFIETDNSGGGAKIFMAGTAVRQDGDQGNKGNNGNDN
jgi:hypothetical protein